MGEVSVARARAFDTATVIDEAAHRIRGLVFGVEQMFEEEGIIPAGATDRERDEINDRLNLLNSLLDGIRREAVGHRRVGGCPGPRGRWVMAAKNRPREHGAWEAELDALTLQDARPVVVARTSRAWRWDVTIRRSAVSGRSGA